ncbi:NYN domain-containing protein [Saccharopolyspora gregorii]|uniref:NYN domain-containing protein n=1 Tax=Saccharopolyspora gregorii TaxID=33914 RepID=UPI00359FBF9F
MVPPTSGADSPRTEESAVDGPRQAPVGAPETGLDQSAPERSRECGAEDPEELPAPVRARLAELAAEALDDVRPSDVPAPLRPVVRFAPAKRAKLGRGPLVAALRDSPVFRTAVVDWCRENRPEGLDGVHPDPVVVAVAGVLLALPNTGHYLELVAFRVEQGRLRGERDSAQARAQRLAGEVDRLQAELAEARRAGERAGDESGSEADRLRKRLREQGVRLKEAKDDAQAARAELAEAHERIGSELAELRAQRDRERARAQEERDRAQRAAAETEVARQSAREARQGDEVRISLLLETMEGALGGLRRELRAVGHGPRPADVVQRVRPDSGETGRVADAAALDRLLALPAVHLIVDGYNVTKTGYPDLPLADQRNRLAHQLAALAARTGAEVTVVFDGADVLSVPTAGPRGVRVMFSPPGVIADDVIRELVVAEPQGRQLVVATSDRAVVTSVRRTGAYAVASAVLLERLNRV